MTSHEQNYFSGLHLTHKCLHFNLREISLFCFSHSFCHCFRQDIILASESFLYADRIHSRRSHWPFMVKVEMKQWELWPFFGCFFIFENTWIFIKPEIQVVSLENEMLITTFATRARPCFKNAGATSSEWLALSNKHVKSWKKNRGVILYCPWMFKQILSGKREW